VIDCMCMSNAKVPLKRRGGNGITFSNTLFGFRSGGAFASTYTHTLAKSKQGMFKKLV